MGGSPAAAEADQGAARLLGRRGECEALDHLLTDVLAGASRVTVLRGDAGVGKSALLAYVSGRVAGWHVVTAAGVESEMELAYSGLHQLCAPMLDHIDRLPGPQRDALATVFGLSAGPAPDRFLVGLAVLSLLAEAAEQRPLICIVDDAQWLDQASAQVLAFVARRLLAERVAMVCAVRTGIGDEVLAGLPALPVGGLSDSDARALLLANVHGPLDAAVCDQIITESHGNPLAVLELPRTWRGPDIGGGFGLPGSQPVAGKVEQSYARRLLVLPADTRLFVLAAAAEPLGDPCCSTVPLRRSASARLWAARRRTPGSCRYAGAWSSPIRSSDRPPTGRRLPTTATGCIAPLRRRPTPRRTPTGAPGTAPRPRRGPTKRSPRSSSARPAGRSPAEASLRLRRF
jgi:AAA ATPase-like protein